MIKLNKFIKTSGKGYWSKNIKDVKISKIEWDDFKKGRDQLVKIYFTKKTWNINEDGLIYTDYEFLQALKNELITNYSGDKYPDWNKLNYTEQGVQGANYISCILGKW